MGGCDLSDSSFFGSFYYDYKKVSTKAKCLDCGLVSKKNYSYPLYSINDKGDEKRTGINYLCDDCHSLHDAFSICVLGTARNKIQENFKSCWARDFDIALLDKLTPRARDFVLRLVDEIQEEEEYE